MIGREHESTPGSLQLILAPRHQMRNMTAPGSEIPWFHFCTTGGNEDMWSIFTVRLWAQQLDSMLLLPSRAVHTTQPPGPKAHHVYHYPHNHKLTSSILRQQYFPLRRQWSLLMGINMMNLLFVFSIFPVLGDVKELVERRQVRDILGFLHKNTEEASDLTNKEQFR